MTKMFIQGIPIAKGSMKAFVNKYTGKPIIVRANDKEQDAWAASIKVTAASHFPEGPSLSKPVELYMTFYMPRPKKHFSRDEETIKEKYAGEPHKVKPDLDKLVRLVMDALTGIAYMDDSHVIYIEAEKAYTNTKPGLALEIEQ